MKHSEYLDKLYAERKLSHAEWTTLIGSFTEADRDYAAELAAEITKQRFGNRVFFRGLIEFSNICKNDCFYCGIRRSNADVRRYRLTESEILDCCREGYRLGYRTFVLQSGEDGALTDSVMTHLVTAIKEQHPDCAVTLSLGERSYESYAAMFAAGADRYLLRHETANAAHYAALHPSAMSFDNRIRCLYDLKNIGYQVGCGMMVGTPHQTAETLADDMEWICRFQPEMVGIGPFLPHCATPFAAYPSGSRSCTLFLLSLTRIMLPDVLLPATTALGTAAEDGYMHGVLAGCNVVMPNLSPQNVRKHYLLYDNKSGTEVTAEESFSRLKQQMEAVGREVVTSRGDHIRFERKHSDS